jgi:hypothetical protein
MHLRLDIYIVWDRVMDFVVFGLVNYLDKKAARLCEINFKFKVSDD